ncbi:SpoIIE family protein phosphatase [Acidothermaceae bacterium B102]|nr:SpoIIE family protein phosphatase [Acidothermaceae bacterium B102]
MNPADLDVRRALSLLEALFADAAVGLGMFDADLRYLRVNGVLHDIIGVPLEELYGRRPSEAMPGFGEGVEAVLRRVAETGVALREVELRGRTPATPDADHNYLCSYFPLTGPDGAAIGLASIVRDVSERRQSVIDLAAAHDRLALLSLVGQVIGSSLSTRDTLAALAALTVPRFADHCVVDLVDLEGEQRGLLRRMALVHVEEVREAGDIAWRGNSGLVTYPPGHPVTTVIASGSALLVRDVPGELPDEETHNLPGSQFSRQVGVRSLLVLPLTSRGILTGVVSWAVSVSGRAYDDADLAVAEEIAGRFSVALDNAHAYETQQAVALTLQRSLLPRQLPESEGLEPESVYLPGAGDTEVGGDWFDLIPLSTGRTGIVIGDVMGRGIHAAAVMGQLRAATRAFAVLDLAPAEVLRHLDELVVALDAVQIVTCVYAVFDPSTSTLTIANAGHLPPLVLHDGVAQRLDLDTGTPLGIGAVRFVQRDVALPPGDAVVLYTDGLVETRGSDLDDGIERLRAALTAHSPVGGTCTSALRALLDDDAVEYDDDVAMLVLRATAADREPLVLRLPARAEAPRMARDAARTALSGWGLSADVTDNVALVVSELVTNAVLHTGSSPTLRLRTSTGAVYVEVTDDDSRQPRMRDPEDDEDSGRGLHLIEALSRRWNVRTTASGKVVWAEIPC